MAENKTKSFLMLNRKMSQHIVSEVRGVYAPLVLPFLLYLYREVYKWDENYETGTVKVTLKEMAEAIGMCGTSKNYYWMRAELQLCIDKGYLSGMKFYKKAPRPSDLIKLSFHKSVFSQEKKSFVRAFDEDIDKIFGAKHLIKLQKNSLVNVVNLWFLLSCHVYPEHPSVYSHKHLRKQLALSDQTIAECYGILEEIGLFSRVRIFNPERGHFQYLHQKLPHDHCDLLQLHLCAY